MRCSSKTMQKTSRPLISAKFIVFGSVFLFLITFYRFILPFLWLLFGRGMFGLISAFFTILIFTVMISLLIYCCLSRKLFDFKKFFKPSSKKIILAILLTFILLPLLYIFRLDTHVFLTVFLVGTIPLLVGYCFSCLIVFLLSRSREGK